MTQPVSPRRPVAARSHRWAQSAARKLSSLGISPNQVSLASIIFAIVGFVCLWVSGQVTTVGIATFLYALAILMIYARLLCNLLDGMIAIEGGHQSPSGELFNEIPDRIADSLFLIGAGLATASHQGAALGVIAAIGAVLTAYIRALGSSLGSEADFQGPMAKPHRMHTLAAGLMLASLTAAQGYDGTIMLITLTVIGGLTWFTAWRRFTSAQRQLEVRNQD